MLARAVPGAVVVVGADRYAAGRHAERALGATVHLLDDGFQHVQLGPRSRHRRHAGRRARRPTRAAQGPAARAARRAVARVAAGRGGRRPTRGGRGRGPALGVPRACGARASAGRRRSAVHGGVPPPGARVVAWPASASRRSSSTGLRAAGWQVVATRGVRAITTGSRPRDLARVARRSSRTSAWGVLTTDKDAVRLEPLGRAALRRRARAAGDRRPAGACSSTR